MRPKGDRRRWRPWGAARCAPETAKRAAAAAAAEQPLEDIAKIGALAAKACETALSPARVAAKAAAAVAEWHGRIAVGVDLAAVELGPLRLVGEQIISLGDVGESLRRFRIILVPVGVQLFRELAIGRLDFSFARRFRDAEGGIGICHFSPVAR
jgi:hypothetical protein